MQSPESTGDSTLRRRAANQPDTNSQDRRDGTTAQTTAVEGSTTTTTTTTVTSIASSSSTASTPDRQADGKVYYNGQTYEGTGRLPRDAPFTPTYVNAYTFNSAVAFISLIVTASFFYFKIIAGILESPQIGPDREFQSSMSYMGPADQGEPRPILTPLCPMPEQLQEIRKQRGNGDRASDDDDCALFGKIVVLADSISTYGYTHVTHGWLGSLSDEWAGRADVALRGFPGYNTHWIKSIFPDLLHQESKSVNVAPVKLVVIALGTDDASFPNTRQHVSLEAYKENLRSLISSIRYPESPNYSPDTQVILVTPAPVHDTMWEASLTAVNKTLDRSNSVTKEYADACVQVGDELQLPVVNIWHDIQCQVEGTCQLHESDKLEDYFMDGFHLRRMGNEVLYRGVMNAVALHYPQLHPICWSTVFPGYSTESSPEQSILKRHCNSNNHNSNNSR
ncbi:hypothetical protein BGX26_012972 [Mortierella sp. AD094]|nr:hypothetical protein BGX26_012972 [Mortierella sp. AD094]